MSIFQDSKFLMKIIDFKFQHFSKYSVPNQTNSGHSRLGCTYELMYSLQTYLLVIYMTMILQTSFFKSEKLRPWRLFLLSITKVELFSQHFFQLLLKFHALFKQIELVLKFVFHRTVWFKQVQHFFETYQSTSVFTR